MLERDFLTLSFREVQVKFSKLYAIILHEANLTLPQYALLGQLVVAGPVPMTHLSKYLHISKPAVTNLVDRLEESKCLKRTPHPKDRRIYLLKLEPKGEKLVRKTQAYMLRILLKTLEQFNVREQKTINQFYASLSQTVSKALSDSTKRYS
ncbi:MAG: hypothetical protein A3C35_07095 [Omnitrophica bacterium RIFCSPHIGHO2_02_FULL_46_11]|nr:MAG: hypothetical protein A3C35_07095 [Omnitrophica bacterium RIFCSPHIGHO2_02_FULL_46_11]